MPTYDIAHIKEQGVDLIIVPLNSSFNNKTTKEQNEFLKIFQARSDDAGLIGTVVFIWKVGNNTNFIAPKN